MLRSRTSRFFGAASPEKSFADVAREIGLVIKRDRQRSSDVILASYSIGCDGRPTVSLLDGSPCDPDGGTIGLATRDRALLSGVLPRPYQSNAAEPGGLVTATQTVGDAPPLGRYFVDSLGHVFEGRRETYHAGHVPGTAPNGTPLEGQTASLGPLDLGAAVRTDWNYAYNGGGFNVSFEPEADGIGGWQPVRIDGLRVPANSFDVCYDPAFHFAGPSPFYSLEPYGDNSGGSMPEARFAVESAGYDTEFPLQTYMWAGLGLTNEGGNRDSSAYIVSVEGLFTPNGTEPDAFNGPFTGTMSAWFVVRVDGGVSDMEHVILETARRSLVEVEQFALGAHPDRCATPAYPMGWRAGIQVRPASDGTFVLSVLDSTRAWVFEVVPNGAGAKVALLETVYFPSPYSGVVRAIYR